MYIVAPLAGAWIETKMIKIIVQLIGRTPCGCVD